jgi:hypothetical protein
MFTKLLEWLYTLINWPTKKEEDKVIDTIKEEVKNISKEK